MNHEQTMEAWVAAAKDGTITEQDLEQVRAELQDPTSRFAITQLIYVAARSFDDEAVPVVEGFLDHDDTTVRAAAIWAFGWAFRQGEYIRERLTAELGAYDSEDNEAAQAAFSCACSYLARYNEYDDLDRAILTRLITVATRRLDAGYPFAARAVAGALAYTGEDIRGFDEGRLRQVLTEASVIADPRREEHPFGSEDEDPAVDVLLTDRLLRGIEGQRRRIAGTWYDPYHELNESGQKIADVILQMELRLTLPEVSPAERGVLESDLEGLRRLVADIDRLLA